MDRWNHTEYVVKERRLTFGRQYRVFAKDGSLVAYCKQKMFKLKEDIVFYADESKQEEVMRLQATKVLDFNANLALNVPKSSGKGMETLGFLRRKGWKSMIRDEWQAADPKGNLLGTLHEDSTAMALFRRFGPFGALFPHKYHFARGASESDRAFEIKERFQLYGDTYDVVIQDFDPRIAVAFAVLVDALEQE